MPMTVAALSLTPVHQKYLLQARQMQALSFAVHIPLVCFAIAVSRLSAQDKMNSFITDLMNKMTMEEKIERTRARARLIAARES